MRRLALCLTAAATVLPAPAYYHFVHYLAGGNAPEKFDLSVLPSKTVTFYVSENGPSTYSGTDNFNSVLSQLRQATQVWNGVNSSDLRVAFGGLENNATPQNTPGGDIVFEDLPPGLLGYSTPTASTTPVTAANGSQFFPLVRSTVHLNRNLTLQPGPSYRETFFMTTVHEMGHSLGLQHTFTSSTMSQATTRATTLSHPIDADDIAGISVLYPNSAFSQFGSITGRVTTNGNAAHLTSVVAIRAGSGAISALTSPDGTYRIDGVPPGQYFVYAHPIPPDADIQGPWNSDGTVNPGSGPTNALFYPGTTNVQQASPISVQQGKSFDGVNIALNGRSSVPLYDVQIFSYFNNNTIAVEPAFVNTQSAKLVGTTAQGTGLGANGKAPGLNVQILGGSAYIADGGILPAQSNGSTYVGLYVGFNLGASTGPQHIVFTTPDYLYVLPSGISLTQKFPPTVTAVSNNGDGTATVSGSNWNSDSLIYFDGLPAAISSLDSGAGKAIVTPPAGANGQSSVVTVYNSDGQNSQLVQSASPVTYSYGNTSSPAITAVSPNSLPAGAEAVVDVTGTGLTFAPGGTSIGFGTTDVVVRRVFVLGPNHLQADVSVSPAAALTNSDVSVFSGFQNAIAPGGFQISPAVNNLQAVVPLLTNALPGLTGSYPGATVNFSGANLAASNSTPVVTFSGQAAAVLSASSTQLTVQIPQNLPPGPATLNVNGALPVVVSIDTQPASIGSVQNTSGTYIDSTHPAHQGDLLTVGLNNFAPSGATVTPDRVQVSVGGTLHNATQVSSPAVGVWQVSFLLNANDNVGTSQPLIVYLDGRSSYPANINVVAQ